MWKNVIEKVSYKEWDGEEVKRLVILLRNQKMCLRKVMELYYQTLQKMLLKMTLNDYLKEKWRRMKSRTSK